MKRERSAKRDAMPMKPYFSKVSDFIDLLKAQDFEYCQSPASDAPVVSIISSFYKKYSSFRYCYLF